MVQRRVDIKTRGIVCLEGSVDEGIQASDAHELPVRAYMEAPQRARGQWSARAWPARTAIFDFLSTFYAGSRRGGASLSRQPYLNRSKSTFPQSVTVEDKYTTRSRLQLRQVFHGQSLTPTQPTNNVSKRRTDLIC